MPVKKFKLFLRSSRGNILFFFFQAPTLLPLLLGFQVVRVPLISATHIPNSQDTDEYQALSDTRFRHVLKRDKVFPLALAITPVKLTQFDHATLFMRLIYGHYLLRKECTLIR